MTPDQYAPTNCATHSASCRVAIRTLPSTLNPGRQRRSMSFISEHATVETKPLSWELRMERCPCCDGPGELVFRTCPTCGLVVLICAEVGTVFEIRIQQHGSVIGESIDAENVCTKCGRNRYSVFRSATADEILALGFQPGDYR
jgi:hypothetical protein